MILTLKKMDIVGGTAFAAMRSVVPLFLNKQRCDDYTMFLFKGCSRGLDFFLFTIFLVNSDYLLILTFTMF